MDNLRLFSTFPASNKTFKKLPQKVKKLLPRDKNGMVNISLDEKPYVSRQDIADKLKERNEGKVQKMAKPKGQKFGMNWMEAGEKASVGDVSKNDPSDPMTSEKLKTILSSGGVNFNDKEQQILKKILG